MDDKGQGSRLKKLPWRLAEWLGLNSRIRVRDPGIIHHTPSADNFLDDAGISDLFFFFLLVTDRGLFGLDLYRDRWKETRT